MTERFGVERGGGEADAHIVFFFFSAAPEFIHSVVRCRPGSLTNSEVISAIRWVVVDSKQFKWIHYYISRGGSKENIRKKKNIYNAKIYYNQAQHTHNTRERTRRYKSSFAARADEKGERPADIGSSTAAAAQSFLAAAVGETCNSISFTNDALLLLLPLLRHILLLERMDSFSVYTM